MYLVLVLTTVICVIFQIDSVQQIMQWDIHALASGQWWRILTGNFTHTNIWHLLMNLAGLWVISYLFTPSKKQLLVTLITISALVGIGLLWSSIQIYVGLSGTLHGLFGYFALNEALRGRKSSWLLVLGLILKVGWEQFYGASESTSAMIAARVAIEAHLVGGFAGLTGALSMYFYDKSDAK
ncbi:rhombosortase [Vibrio sp. T187]|uniref:rhombosortase n=1 Tax=Vibrio TaxID=662 RepID=UPI0010C95848|nr:MULTISPECIES: rhombosortase [Vibrio]MBW3694533.1 rhombosortase [Vibrio sp. T187]